MSPVSTIARAAVLSLAVLAIAWPTPGRSSEPSIVGTGWRIVEIAGRPADPGATIAFEKTRVSGSTGCNRFFASLQVNATTVAMGPIATTKMFCGTRTSVERDTLSALSRVTTATRHGERVSLLDAGGKPVVVLGR